MALDSTRDRDRKEKGERICDRKHPTPESVLPRSAATEQGVLLRRRSRLRASVRGHAGRHLVLYTLLSAKAPVP